MDIPDRKQKTEDDQIIIDRQKDVRSCRKMNGPSLDGRTFYERSMEDLCKWEKIFFFGGGGGISVFFGRGLEKWHANWKQGSMYPAMNLIQR
jgi:hypothetical protein